VHLVKCVYFFQAQTPVRSECSQYSLLSKDSRQRACSKMSAFAHTLYQKAEQENVKQIPNNNSEDTALKNYTYI